MPVFFLHQADTFEDDADHIFLGFGELFVAKRLIIVKDFNLSGKVGVMLGGGKDHIHQRVGLDIIHLAFGDPAANHHNATVKPAFDRC